MKVFNTSISPLSSFELYILNSDAQLDNLIKLYKKELERNNTSPSRDFNEQFCDYYNNLLSKLGSHDLKYFLQYINL